MGLKPSTEKVKAVSVFYHAGFSSGSTSPFRLNAVPKPNARSDEGNELGGIDPSPAPLGHVEELEGHEQALLA